MVQNLLVSEEKFDSLAEKILTILRRYGLTNYCCMGVENAVSL